MSKKQVQMPLEKEVMSFKVALSEDPDVGGYNVTCPALRGCRSQGDTVEEALDNIKDAIKLYLETVDELNKEKEVRVIKITI